MLEEFHQQYRTETLLLLELVDQKQETWSPVRNLELFQKLEWCQVISDPLEALIEISSSPCSCAWQ